jgi:hypothetical protein
MDGTLDAAGYRLATNGIQLYAALRGTKLYVATTSPGTTGPNDHFIFVSDVLLASATTPAPWGKDGTTAVAASKPFLSTESQNAYLAWNNAPTGSLAAKSGTTSGVLEGTIDLVAAFGALPANIYLCAAAYATADGGALAAQSPAGTGPNIEPGEFLIIPTVALRDHNADGKFDRLDPLLDFRLQTIIPVSDRPQVSWAAMPGRAYQLVYRDAITGAWMDLPGSLTNAGPLQTTLGFPDPGLFTNGQRFYNVKLLP